MELNVLMVDDSENDIILVRHALGNLGSPSAFRHVHSVDEGIEYLAGRGLFSRRDHPFPDAMLLDIKMPGKSGFEMLEYMRDHPQHKVVPTVMFSSSFHDDDVSKAYQLGVHAFFEKPTGLTDLVYLFKTMLAYWELSKWPVGEQRWEAAA